MRFHHLRRLVAICHEAVRRAPLRASAMMAFAVAFLAGLACGAHWTTHASAPASSIAPPAEQLETAASETAASESPAAETPVVRRATAGAALAPAGDWVRTKDGWERASWRSVRPRRFPHPAIVASFLLLASLLALVAFSPIRAES